MGMAFIAFYIPTYIIASIIGIWLSVIFARNPIARRVSDPIGSINLNIFGAIGSGILAWLILYIIDPKDIGKSIFLVAFVLFASPIITGIAICQAATLLSDRLKEKASNLYHLGIGAFHGTWTSTFALIIALAGAAK